MQQWTFDSLRVGRVAHQRVPVVEPIEFEPEIETTAAPTALPGFEPPPPLPPLAEPVGDKKGWSLRDCARWIRCCW